MSKPRLHLLSFSQPSLFNLGISQSPLEEAKRLEPYLGKPDWDKSFTVVAPARVLAALLDGLTHLLAEHAIATIDPCVSGLYEASALDTALNYVRIHGMLGQGAARLQRGPRAGVSKNTVVGRKGALLAERSRQLVAEVAGAVASLSRINRLLLLLSRRVDPSRYRFEYTREGARVVFFLPLNERSHLPNPQSFRLCLSELNGKTEHHLISSSQCAEYVEYKLTWPLIPSGTPSALLLEYFIANTRQVLATIPVWAAGVDSTTATLRRGGRISRSKRGRRSKPTAQNLKYVIVD
jgi:hypothetical protein